MGHPCGGQRRGQGTDAAKRAPPDSRDAVTPYVTPTRKRRRGKIREKTRVIARKGGRMREMYKAYTEGVM